MSPRLYYPNGTKYFGKQMLIGGNWWKYLRKIPSCHPSTRENGTTSKIGIKNIPGSDKLVWCIDEWLLCVQVGLFNYISVYIKLNFQLVGLKGLHNPVWWKILSSSHLLLYAFEEQDDVKHHFPLLFISSLFGDGVVECARLSNTSLWR